ncbi:radical SAM protein [Lewinella sp. 4G2]|uniref:B12-binding domain-containing radical SAM protein n=1 Tax=Lewinella sp. 4G2 TaxID=1803372 RepID=UPI0007B4BAB9|nr:radical SAM protein [Lewinella sp. 4G2]OAV44982.1 radical SAM protein [Lewinella sp. 4G2]
MLLITPPFTQLNTPYPATAYLKGFLNTKGIPARQMDLGIEVILELFSQPRLREAFALAAERETIVSANARRIYALREEYFASVESVIAFLQGKQPTLARQIASENFLPHASRFDQLSDLDYAFGAMGHQDKAKHLATLYLEDLSDFIVEALDPDFGFSRYAERLGRSANSFEELHDKLSGPPTFIDGITLALLDAVMQEEQPKLVCFSVPFPGNLYSAFRCAQYIKAHYPVTKTAMGGGFANTELRSVSDPRVFDYFDFITLDDGELPIELLWSNLIDPSPQNPNHQLYKRTFLRQDGEVIHNDYSLRQDYKMNAVGTPDYTGLPLDQYVSVIEVTNPMHSLWSDGRWNKLTMAHGCYWGKCTFCDVSLDYIGNYQPVRATVLVDRMEEIIAQTGENGFHFVDEAAPPALMRDLALEIIRRKLRLTWWTNIRFEKNFTPDLCRLLQASGCIAVSGGLEVASDRLLALIQKGVTVEQVARVTGAFTDAGIMVHAYLMYGYPTQTIQETVDSLEMVRQLFQAGVIQSGFWHQFALTAHSPVGLDPEAYGVVPDLKEITFANNDVQFKDATGIDHGQFSFGLKKSLFNYMHGTCFDYPLQEWFDFEIPETSIDPEYIQRSLEYQKDALRHTSRKLVWVGGTPDLEVLNDKQVQLTLFDRRDTDSLALPQVQGRWVRDLLIRCGNHAQPYPTLKATMEAYEEGFVDFWQSEEMELIRAYGLLVV